MAWQPVGGGSAFARTLVKLEYDCVYIDGKGRLMEHRSSKRRINVPLAQRLAPRTAQNIRVATGVSREAFIDAWKRKPAKVICPNKA